MVKGGEEEGGEGRGEEGREGKENGRGRKREGEGKGKGKRVVSLPVKKTGPET